MDVKSFRVVLLTVTLLLSGRAILAGNGELLGSVTREVAPPDARALGKAYAPVLATTYADGWVAAAKALEDGKSVEECRKVLQETWKGSRQRSFQAILQPDFSKVLSEGTEPADVTQRARVAAFWKSFASGLRGEQ